MLYELYLNLKMYENYPCFNFFLILIIKSALRFQIFLRKGKSFPKGPWVETDLETPL